MLSCIGAYDAHSRMICKCRLHACENDDYLIFENAIRAELHEDSARLFDERVSDDHLLDCHDEETLHGKILASKATKYL